MKRWSAFALELVLGSEEGVEAAQSVDVRYLDPLTHDPQVLLVAKPLHRPFHGVDVETDAARQIDG